MLLPMTRAIFLFELRQHLRSPPFWIVAAISGLLVFGSIATERIRIGVPPGGLRNGPEAVLQVHGVWSLFFAFTAVAFVADAVLRDRDTGFAPVLASTGVRKAPYLIGRFAGAFAATLLCFLSVPFGVLAGGAAPWLGPELVGPPALDAIGFAFAAVALPNLFLLSAAVFALATTFRSALAGYLGAVALVALYGLGTGPGENLPPLAEPFGFAALRSGDLLANRALWTAVAGGLLAVAFVRFRFEAAPAAVRQTVEDRTPPPASRPLAAPRFGPRTTRAQFALRLHWEARATFRSTPFLVVVALGLANAGAALLIAAGDGADTQGLIGRLIDGFRLVPLVVAILYAGELVHAERDARIEPLTAAAPAPDEALLFPKLLALFGVLLAVLVATAALGIAVDLLAGAPGADLQAWLLWYVLPRAWDWLAFATLAIFLQVVSPSKLAGWGWIVLHLIVSLTLENLALNDPLYRYGGRLDGPLAELLARNAGQGVLIRTYWGAVAVALATLAYLFHGRAGRSGASLPSQARRRLAGPAGATLVVAASVAGACGVALAS